MSPQRTSPSPRDPRPAAVPAVVALAATLAFFSPFPPALPAQTSGPEYAPETGANYSYLRVVEGPATLTRAGADTSAHAEMHIPILPGDLLSVPLDSRIEAILSDGNVVRLDGGTELIFESLARSPEGAGGETALRLERGAAQLLITAGSEQDSTPRVETANASVYLHREGAYRINTDGRDRTTVVIREGWAEVATDRGSVVVRGGEEARIEGTAWPRSEIRAAGYEDDLELWGARLDEEAALADAGAYVGEELRYAAAPLSRHGAWVEVSDGYAWRPHVAADWRPYWNGYWAPSASGLFWISHEPWGWVPYHYGSWDRNSRHGWLWHPGHAFAPAWVTWYWGPSHVGWVPSGYYSHYYGPRYQRRYGFAVNLNFGTLGWAGGSYSHYRDWVFCPVSHFGRRGAGRHLRRGSHLHHGDQRGHGAQGGGSLPRGIITTDTRGIRPHNWRDPDAAREVLLRSPRDRRVDGPRGNGRGELPDVTAFIAREPSIPADVERRIVARAPERGLRAPADRQTRQLRPSAATPPSRTVIRRGPTERRKSGDRSDRNAVRRVDRPREKPPETTRSTTPRSPERVEIRRKPRERERREATGDERRISVRTSAPSRPPAASANQRRTVRRTPNQTPHRTTRSEPPARRPETRAPAKPAQRSAPRGVSQRAPRRETGAGPAARSKSGSRSRAGARSRSSTRKTASKAPSKAPAKRPAQRSARRPVKKEKKD